MTIVYLKCERGHEIAVDVPRPKGLLKLCERGKRVCTQCKPDNVRLAPYTPEESPGCINDKRYACRHGHITNVTPFTNGHISISWGDENENVSGTPEDVPGWIEDGKEKCRHKVTGSSGRTRKCGCKLISLDDAVLDYANTSSIKTRVRVGDLWDKAGCPESIESHHETFRKHGEEDARFVKTEFSKRQKLRLKRLRRNNRQSDKVGEVLTRPTDTTGEKLSKDQALRGARKDYN